MGQTEKHFKAEESSYYKVQIEKNNNNDCGDGETSSLANTQREEEMKKKKGGLALNNHIREGERDRELQSIPNIKAHSSVR